MLRLSQRGVMLVNIWPSLSIMAHLAQSTEMAIGRNVEMLGMHSFKTLMVRILSSGRGKVLPKLD